MSQPAGRLLSPQTSSRLLPRQPRPARLPGKSSAPLRARLVLRGLALALAGVVQAGLGGLPPQWDPRLRVLPSDGDPGLGVFSPDGDPGGLAGALALHLRLVVHNEVAALMIANYTESVSF